MKLYNTLHRKVEDFETLAKGRAGLYTCGPTVYNYAHIGNLRTYIFEDLLRRTLEFEGYRVHHVMNITDVGHLTDDADDGEDKMTKSARERKMSVWEIAAFFTEAFFHDTQRLNILKPHVSCRATEHIDDMISLIQRIEENGYTYVSGGNVYFDISKSRDYGKLALLDKQDLRAGARVKVDTSKRNPHDFALWFTNSKFEHQAMLWDSPWGRGYPGWHVECSAMSMKYLGDQFDIHCGGIDHIPVHHTNEIAQSEAATGKKWVNYWLHSEFLVIDKGKMAKSKGNFLTLGRLIEEGFEPLDYRYFCLGAHYRSQLQFSFEGLQSAASARKNLTEKILELKKQVSGTPLKPDMVSEKYINAFGEHLSNDLNVPQTLADLWGVMKDETLPPEEKLATVYKMDEVFALDLESAEAEEAVLPPDMMSLVRKREEARKAKDFQLADELRGLLEKKGIQLKDTPQGTEWKKLK